MLLLGPIVVVEVLRFRFSQVDPPGGELAFIPVRHAPDFAASISVSGGSFDTFTLTLAGLELVGVKVLSKGVGLADVPLSWDSVFGVLTLPFCSLNQVTSVAWFLPSL